MLNSLPANNSGLDAFFRALAAPTRRDIVEALAEGPQQVSHLARRYQMSLPAVSQHLSVLIDCGVVISKRSGRNNLCSLNPNAMRVIEDWVSARQRQLENRLERFAGYLESEKGAKS